MQDEFESATQDAQQAGAKVKASAGAARDEMRRTAEDVQEQFASSARTAKEQFGDAADTIKHKARAMADDQKAAGADQLSGLARAINMAAWPPIKWKASCRRPQAMCAKPRSRSTCLDHDPRAQASRTSCTRRTASPAPIRSLSLAFRSPLVLRSRAS